MKFNASQVIDTMASRPGRGRLFPASRTSVYLLLLFFLAACRPNPQTWDRIEQSGTLRIGMDPTYPPFEVADSNGVQGLDVDLAHALAANLGLRAEFVYFGYDGLYDALATEQVDLLISALVIVPERMRDFAYSEPYFNAGEILIVPQTEADISGMANLDDRILAVELGALGHVEANVWSSRLPNLIVQAHHSAAEAVTAVAQAQADAALVDAISGLLALKDHPQLKRLPTPVTVEPFAIVARIEDDVLLNKINASLENLKKNGQLDTITAQWLDVGSND